MVHIQAVERAMRRFCAALGALALATGMASAGNDWYPIPPDAGRSTDNVACLALNIYWEGRSEPAKGQQAIAHVTLNRVADKAFPGTICAVVRQGGDAVRHRCQFSWWCDGKSDQPRDPQAWNAAMFYARAILEGRYPDPTGGALFFHRDGISPSWTRAREWTTRIGLHHYYR